MNGIQEHHHWSSVVIAAALALIVGGVAGYYIGASQNGTQAPQASTSVVDEIGEGVERPTNPFEQSGYQNPLQGVKVNPFE